MKKILILIGRYLPGYKDGGPVRTIINLTEALGDEYDFHIVALDRDHGDTKPYDNIKYNEWNKVGKARVRYVQPKGFSFKLLRSLIKDADLVYTCGFYSDYGYKTLILNRLKKVYKKPIVVASMGTFSKGALSQKSLKKNVFIGLFKLLGLFKNITWSVTSELEAEDLLENVGSKAKYVVAEDLPRTSVSNEIPTNKSDCLRVVFLSRICPHKNLHTAIKILSDLKEKIHFSVCGPIEDTEYFDDCVSELNKLPGNITWEYKGNIPSEQVQEELSKHDVMLLPTLGENYCHVVFEALSVGCIPVISDTTPWQDLDVSNCGYVLSLNNTEEFRKVISSVACMENDKFSNLSVNAVNYAKDKVKSAITNTGYRTIFNMSRKEDI